MLQEWEHMVIVVREEENLIEKMNKTWGEKGKHFVVKIILLIIEKDHWGT